MKGVHKPFNKQAYQQYDATAREIVRRHLIKANFMVTDNPDTYGPDLIVDGAYVEVEVKTNWGNTDIFPYDEVNILERKAKYFKQGASLWLLNITMNRALIILPSSIYSSRLVEVKNKFCPSGELFYKVPVEETTLVKLETLW